jgi:anaerobic selenocysteine-containing dehydrogenase
MREALTFCRLCSALCGVRLTLDDQDRVVKIRGDKAHPLTRGYSCAKGVCHDELHNSPERLLHPVKRRPDGGFERIPLAQALDEIAARVRTLVDEEGARSIAAFLGTWGYNNATFTPMLRAWMDALGSPSRFTSLTVDQSAKIITIGRMGRWSAGRQGFAGADVWMIFGGNPLVSGANTTGMPSSHPLKQLKEAKARGLRLVVVDPRRTETARYADIHLQPYPGEDPAIAAGLLHIMLSRGLYDAEFCAAHTEGLDALRAAVAPFTPEAVAARAGVAAADLIAAAELWGGSGYKGSKRGCAYTSTGPCMSAHSNLADHMVELLNAVGGRYLREGEMVENALLPGPRRAEALAPSRWWERGPRGMARDDIGTLPGVIGREFPCGILADEVLTEQPGRIRGLFVAGGNPALAFPDQDKVVRALRSLDLLVAIDPFLSPTARLAHYVIPPRMQYERTDSIPINGQIDLMPLPFMQLAQPIARPPEGAEVIEDWTLFWELGRRMGLQLHYEGTPLDMQSPPQSKALLELLCRSREVPFEELWNAPRGMLFSDRQRRVEAARPGHSARLALLPSDVAEELRSFAAAPAAGSGTVGFTHLLASRRMRDAMNSLHHEAPTLKKRHAYNPAFIHPGDIVALGLAEGERVHIVSDHGRIDAVLAADESLRPGVVQMSHSWGALPGESQRYEDVGANVGRLISNERNTESINVMARQSGIPVNIVAAGTP